MCRASRSYLWLALFVVLGATCLAPRSAALASADAPLEGHTLAQDLALLNSTETDQWQVDVHSEQGPPPRWLTEYIAFHRAARGQPGTRYLIHICSPKYFCEGLGDRIRGVIYSLIIARMHRLVLLIHWESPGPLETFLAPSEIDWRLTPELNVSVADAFLMHEFANASAFNPPPKADGKHLLIWTTLFNGKGLPPDMPEFERVSWTSHLCMKALFRPSEELLQRTDAMQRELMGGLDNDFVAIHLRFAHMDGEPEEQNRFGQVSPLNAVMAAWQCARRMARAIHAEQMQRAAAVAGHGGAGGAQGSTSTAALKTTRRERELLPQGTRPAHPAAGGLLGALWPRAWGAARRLAARAGPAGPPQRAQRVLLITDHYELRHMVREGFLGGVVGPLGDAHHISQATIKGNDTRHWNTFVDLLLLTRARCLVWADSGFPKTAMMWGWHKCSREVSVCVRDTFNHHLHGRARRRRRALWWAADTTPRHLTRHAAQQIEREASVVPATPWE